MEQFESRVILDGSQTARRRLGAGWGFESRVILDGSQTPLIVSLLCPLFESRVILDGSQTVRRFWTISSSLRVVLF